MVLQRSDVHGVASAVTGVRWCASDIWLLGWHKFRLQVALPSYGTSEGYYGDALHDFQLLKIRTSNNRGVE